MAKRIGRPPSEKTLTARAALAHFEASKAAKGGVLGKYDAAGMGRRMAGWNPPAQGPNRALEGLQRIRNRARDVSSNDWSGKSGIQKWTTSLIGIGITPRFKRINSATRRREIIDLWNDFVQKSDADCVLSLYGQQTLVVRSWLDAGEVFARRRERFLDEGLPVPMQVQLLEAEFVPLLDADTYQGLPANHRIRSGIELDRRGRRVAYWMFKEHPGDNISYVADDLVRILARDVCHVFEPERPGQLRGVSMLAPVLNRLKNIENYDDATLTRQQLANLVVGFITRGAPTATDDDDIDPMTNQPIETGASGGPLLGLQPGLMQELEDGQKVEWSNPPEAGTTYSEYMRTQHLGTAAAAGVPYEIFSGDIVNVSDRTLRVIINEFRRFNEQRQWQIIIPMFCQRVSDWFAEALVLADLATLEEVDDIRRVEHAPHGWAHIHPVQDPTGKKVEVEAGFRSRSSVVGERGDDIYEVDDERKQDDVREQKLAIGPYNKANQQINNPPPPPAPPAPAPAPVVSVKAQTEYLAEMRSIANDAQKPTVINMAAPVVNVTLPEQLPTEVHNTVNVPEQAPPVVNVSATAPVVNVETAPAVVNVHNEVPAALEMKITAMPERITTSDVVRDTSGNISKATQTETDA